MQSTAFPHAVAIRLDANERNSLPDAGGHAFWETMHDRGDAGGKAPPMASPKLSYIEVERSTPLSGYQAGMLAGTRHAAQSANSSFAIYRRQGFRDRWRPLAR